MSSTISYSSDTHGAELLFGPSHRLHSIVKFLLASIVAMALLLMLVYVADRQYELSQWQKEERSHVAYAAGLLDEFAVMPVSDILALAEESYPPTAGSESITRRFQNQLLHKPNYYQLRYIDLEGLEQVRVQYRGDQVVEVPTAQLQDKLHRDYFQKAISLSRGQVYLSPLELNIEHGEVEQPIQPVFRVATPVFDDRGEKSGIIIINLFGSQLLAPFAELDRSSQQTMSLLNQQGYWLYSSDPSLPWGRQLGSNLGFAEFHPEWLQIQGQSEGQLVLAEGLLTFRRIDKPGRHLINESAKMEEMFFDDLHWYVLSRVDNRLIYRDANHRLELMLIGMLLMILLLIPVSYFWSRHYIRYRYHNLLNRIFFTLAEQSSDIIYVTDRRGVILFANNAAAENSGYTCDELIGQHSNIFKSGRHSEAFYQQLWHNLQEGKEFTEIFINCRKDGSLYTELKTIHPAVDKENDFIFYISSGKNMTRLYKQDQRYLELMDQAVIGTSLRFERLLLLITDYALLAKDSLEQGSLDLARKFIDDINSSTDKAKQLFNEFAYIREQQSEHHFLMPLSQLMDQALEVAQQHYPRHNFEKRMLANFPDALCYRDSMSVALQALLKQVVEMTPNHRLVTLCGYALQVSDQVCPLCGELIDEGMAAVAIRCQGEALEQQVLSRLFEPFYGVDLQTHVDKVYSEINLSIVRNIVHAHSGHITINSNAVGEIEIILYLPTREQAQKQRLSSREVDRSIRAYRQELEQK